MVFGTTQEIKVGELVWVSFDEWGTCKAVVTEVFEKGCHVRIDEELFFFYSDIGRRKADV